MYRLFKQEYPLYIRKSIEIRIYLDVLNFVNKYLDFTYRTFKTELLDLLADRYKDVFVSSFRWRVGIKIFGKDGEKSMFFCKKGLGIMDTYELYNGYKPITFIRV